MTNGVGIGFVKSPEVDAESSGTTVITQTGDNEEFFPTVLAVEVTEKTGVTVYGTFSIGYNSPDFNNICSLVSLVTLQLGINNLFLSCPKVPENTEIKIKPITQSVATTHKYVARLFGNLSS